MGVTPGGRFARAVLDVVDAIPPGRVMTYGDVAAFLGTRAARAVGQVMAHHGSEVPWWRVIRAGGLPPVDKEDDALSHYHAEGTPVVASPTGSCRIRYTDARWWPGEESGTPGVSGAER